MSLTTANVLIALKVIADLTNGAAQIADTIQRAQAEGRDVTPEEIQAIKGKAKDSINKIKGHLAEGSSQ